jgi:hypothetical protein
VGVGYGKVLDIGGDNHTSIPGAENVSYVEIFMVQEE